MSNMTHKPLDSKGKNSTRMSSDQRLDTTSDYSLNLPQTAFKTRAGSLRDKRILDYTIGTPDPTMP